MKVKITIIGPKVHDVGYRPFLIGLAGEMGISRFSVLNTKSDGDQAVVVKADADEDVISAFKDVLYAKKPQAAEVSDIKFEAFEGRVPSMIIASLASMNIQLAKGILAIENINSNIVSMNSTLSQMDSTLFQMNNKMDVMLDKQDQTIGKLDEVGEDITGKLDETRVEISGEVRGLRGDLASKHETCLIRIEKDVGTMKSKMGLAR